MAQVDGVAAFLPTDFLRLKLTILTYATFRKVHKQEGFSCRAVDRLGAFSGR